MAIEGLSLTWYIPAVIVAIILIACIICCACIKKPCTSEEVKYKRVSTQDNSKGYKSQTSTTKQWIPRREYTLDLHNYSTPDAVAKLKENLKQRLNEANKQGYDITLIVITGWGKHSSGHVPHIKPAVIRYLKENSYSYDEDKANPGRINVFICNDNNLV